MDEKCKLMINELKYLKLENSKLKEKIEKQDEGINYWKTNIWKNMIRKAKEI